MSRPVVLTLFLTHECNLACTYCYVHDKRRRPMPVEVGKKAIDLGLTLAKDRMQVSFFGGEPLIEWDLLVELHGYAKERLGERGVRPIFAMTTNGMLLSDRRLEWIRDEGIRIGFSIDGNRAAQDATRCGPKGKSSYERTVERLEAAAKALPDLQTISVVDPSNVAHLADSVRDILARGVRRLTLNPNWGAPEWEEEEVRAVWAKGYDEVAEIYLEHFRRGEAIRVNFIEDKVITRLKEGYAPCDQCDFGKLDFAVAASGRIYPCERQVGADGPDDEAMVIGTVDEGFDKTRQRKIHRAVKAMPDECRTCALNDRCANWCPCANIALTGDPGRPGGLLCWHEQTTTAVADRVAAALYAEKNPAFMARFYA